MADVKKVATRVSYGETLVELGAEHDDFVVLDADLAASTQTGKFKAAYPDRFFDVGIAEQNLMSLAAGIATTGRTAFVSSFAMFAAGRAWEQVRNSIGYPRLNVKVCASHAGLSVGEDGATHQCCEDIALMRAIPGMTVVVPADDVEARAATRGGLRARGADVPAPRPPGDPRRQRSPRPMSSSSGRASSCARAPTSRSWPAASWLARRSAAAEELASRGISAEVINIHTIKPIDSELLLASSAKTGHVVTAEEHSVIGGLGDAVLAALAEHPVPTAQARRERRLRRVRPRA